jgi:4-amino-4-deoxy-L-arabinose transferase-like glycosyltransferase
MLLILALALFTRVLGVGQGLPYIYNADEAVIVNHSLAFGTGDLNPHYFTWPSLYMYVIAIIEGGVYTFGKLAGLFASTDDFIRLFFNNITFFYLPGRLINVLLGVTSVIIVYKLGRRIYNKRIGLVAAAILSVNSLHINYSQQIKTHVPAALLVTLTLWFAHSIYIQKGSWHSYILAGVMAGLSTSTIYHAGLVILSIIIAHIFAWIKNRDSSRIYLFSPWLFAGIAAAFITFIMGTPFALLDWRTFLGDIRATGASFASGGQWEFGILHPFLSLIDSFGWPIGIFTIAGLFYALFRHRAIDLILVSQPIFVGLLLMCFRMKQSHHMLIAYPALSILAALFLTGFVNLVLKTPRLQVVALTIITIAALYPPTIASLQEGQSKTLIDTRTLAKEWIEKNIPSKSVIAMDSGKYYLSTFAPPLRMSRRTLEKLIFRGESIEGHNLSQHEGTRRIAYAGESKYFQMQLKYLDERFPNYDIIQILHNPSDPKSVDMPNFDEYLKEGAQYIIISEKAWSIYEMGSEFDRYHPDKAAQYRLFYRSLQSRALLLKEFCKTDRTQGPSLCVYKVLQKNLS